MRTDHEALIVEARHNGPPGSGNGGWTSGLIASRLDGGITAGCRPEERSTNPDPSAPSRQQRGEAAPPDITAGCRPEERSTNPDPSAPPGTAEVTLRKPPPLQTPLGVVRTEEGLRVIDPQGNVIATARRREGGIEAVPPVPHAVALDAVDRYPGHGTHHFPTCFVCGPQRPDGLRVFPGRVASGGTAAIFLAPQNVDAVTVWAALDCPGGWTVIEGDRPWVLGRFAVAIDELPKPGAECVITGKAVRREGRKALVRTTLYGPGGDVLARGEATWIELAV